MSRKPRKQYRPQEKLAILREHLLEGKPVSEVCDQHGLQPTVSYAWQKQFFENGAAAFERKSRRTEEAKDRRIAALEEKLATRNEVIAELMEENFRSKTASSAESVGRFWFGEGSKLVIWGDSDGFRHPKAMRFSHCQFRFVVQALHDPRRNGSCRPEPIEDQLAVPTQRLGVRSAGPRPCRRRLHERRSSGRSIR